MMRRRGFTLAEIAIAAAVLAFLGVPVLVMLNAGTRETIASEDNVEAELICSGLVEEKLALAYKKLDESVPFDEWLEATSNPDKGGAPRVTGNAAKPVKGRTYRLHRTIKRVTPDCLVLEVVASWIADGRDRRYALLRLVGRETLSAGGGPTE